MSTEEEVALLRNEVRALGGKLDAWRDRVALQEEIAFYSAVMEEFERRLLILEKKVARHRNGEPVPIRMVAETSAQSAAPELEAAA